MNNKFYYFKQMSVLIIILARILQCSAQCAPFIDTTTVEIQQPGLRPTKLFPIGTTEITLSVGFDNDVTPSSTNQFNFLPFTSTNPLCVISSYIMSSQPGTFVANSQVIPGIVTSSVNQPIEFRGMYAGSLWFAIYIYEPSETIFYVCAIMASDGEKVCSSQRVRVSIMCNINTYYSFSQTLLEYVYLPTTVPKLIDFPTDIEPLIQTINLNATESVNCLVKAYEVYEDSTLATPFVSGPIYALTNQIDKTLTQFTTTSTTGINFKALYVLPVNPLISIPSSLLQINIYVCGFELVVPSVGAVINSIIATFNKNTGVAGIQSIIHTVESSKLQSSFARCPIVGYKLVDSSFADLGGIQVTMASTLATTIDVDTSASFIQLVYLRVYTQAMSSYDIPIDLVVCGAETITGTATPISQIYVMNTGLQNIDFTAQVASQIASSNPRCPIIGYDIVDSTYSPVVSQVSVTGNYNIQVDTSLGIIPSQLFIRAFTQDSLAYHYVPLSISFCGTETITGSASPISGVYGQNTGLQNIYFKAQVASKLASSDPNCPIAGYDIVDSSYAPISSQVSVKGNYIIQVDTSLGQVPSQLFLRAYTQYSLSYRYVPMSIYLCGYETITSLQEVLKPISSQKLSELQIDFSWEEQIFDFSDLSSSDSKCPLTTYQIEDHDQYQFVSLDTISKIVRVQTSAITKKLQLFLKASTAYASKKFPFEVLVKNSQEVNFEPFFKDKLPEQIDINIYEGKEYKLQIPEYFDYNMDDLTLEVRGLNNETIRMSEDGQYIVLSQFKKEHAWTRQRINFVLKDSKGAVVKKEMIINLEYNEHHKAQIIEKVQQEITIRKFDNGEKLFNAYISKLDPNGNTTIEFTKPIRIFDKALINSTMLLFIEPSNQTVDLMEFEDPNATFWNMDEDVLKSLINDQQQIETYKHRLVVNCSEFLNFTWRPISFSENYMNLKIDFKYPLNISSLETLRDNLVIVFNASQMYRGKDLSFLNNSMMVKPIRRQLDNDEFSQTYKYVTDYIFIPIALIGIAFYVLQKYQMVGLSALLQTFQNIVLVLLHTTMNLLMPANSMIFTKILKKVMNVDIVEPEWALSKFFDFSFDHELMRRVQLQGKKFLLLNAHLQDMELETYSPMLNIGGLNFSYIYYLILLIQLKVKYVNIKYQEKEGKDASKSKKSFKELKQRLFYRFWFQLITESVISFYLAGVLSVERRMLVDEFSAEDERQGMSENFTNYFGPNLMVKTAFVLLIYLYVTFFISLESLESDESYWKINIGFMLHRLKIESRTQLFFNCWFMLRRITIISVVMILNGYPGLQLQIFFLVNLASIIYLGIVRPLRGQAHMRHEYFNEYMTCQIALMQVIFTDFVPNPESQYLFGWIFIAQIVLAILFNLTVIMFDLGHQIRLRLRKLINRYKGRKNRKNNQPTMSMPNDQAAVNIFLQKKEVAQLVQDENIGVTNKEKNEKKKSESLSEKSPEQSPESSSDSSSQESPESSSEKEQELHPEQKSEESKKEVSKAPIIAIFGGNDIKNIAKKPKETPDKPLNFNEVKYASTKPKKLHAQEEQKTFDYYVINTDYLKKTIMDSRDLYGFSNEQVDIFLGYNFLSQTQRDKIGLDDIYEQIEPKKSKGSNKQIKSKKPKALRQRIENSSDVDIKILADSHRRYPLQLAPKRHIYQK